MTTTEPVDPTRSRIMASVGSKNTRPEMVVRQTAHALGYRFRLHRRDLPGTPDLVFPSRQAVVFVHGCFWHRHDNCRKATMPKTRQVFWAEKFERNKDRDRKAEVELAARGWRIMTIWQCELKDVGALSSRLVKFLGPPRLP